MKALATSLALYMDFENGNRDVEYTYMGDVNMEI